MTTATLELGTLLAWSAPKEINTRMGRRTLRTAPPTDAFSALWKVEATKAELKAAGIGWGKDRDGNWEVCWWQPLSTTQAAEENAAVEASRATTSDVVVPCPDGLAYLPFQRAGIAFLRDHQHTLLADEMGLGKTVQAIGLINSDPTMKRVLVVCPASLKVNWRNELTRWLVRPLTVGIQESGAAWVGNLVDVVVLNYDILAKFPAIYVHQWDLLIADEAHYVKNRNAKRTKLLLGAVKKDQKAEFPGIQARRRVFMTGTPILNKPVEIFPLLESLEPGKWTFKDKIRYCAGMQTRFGWDFSGASNLDELQLRLRRTVMCRRLKREVLTELPPKRRQVIELAANGSSDLVEREAEAFEAHEALLTRLKAEAEVLRLSDDEAAYRLAVEKLKGAFTVAFTEIAQMRHQVALAKLPKVVDHLMSILDAGDKVVVFTHHHDVTDKLAAALSDYSPLIVDGRTDVGERQEIVNRFNAGGQLLLLGIRAAGVGLSVKAAIEVFAELDWTPGIVQQAEDRCHGVGRGIEGEPLLVQHLVLERSLDCRMAKTLVAKQDIADRALDKGASAVVGAEPVLTVTVGSVLEEPEDTAPPRREAAPGQPKAETATKVSDELRQRVHAGLKILAGLDPDYAAAINGVGFNKFDGEFGHSLAERSYLTDKMVLAGAKLCRKYRRQLGGWAE